MALLLGMLWGIGSLPVNLAAGIWLAIDARRRRLRPFPWVAGTLLLGLFVYPFYMARRPLRPGEVRRGGGAWQVISHFASYWTAVSFMAVSFFIIGLMIQSQVQAASQGPKTGGGGWLVVLVLLAITAVWFLVMILALILGLVLRKPGVVQEGPTDALPGSE